MEFGLHLLTETMNALNLICQKNICAITHAKLTHAEFRILFSIPANLTEICIILFLRVFKSPGWGKKTVIQKTPMLRKNSPFSLFDLTRFTRHIALCCSVTQTCSLLLSTEAPADNCRIQAAIWKTLWKTASDSLGSVLLVCRAFPLSQPSTSQASPFEQEFLHPRDIRLGPVSVWQAIHFPPVLYMKRKKEQLTTMEKLWGIFKYFLYWI